MKNDDWNEMNIYSENDKLFDKYFHQQLNEAEKEEFEKRLLEDEKFAIEYQLFTDIVTGIKAASEEKLKERFIEIDKTLDTPIIRSSTWYAVRVAAVIVIFLIGISLFYILKPGKSPEQEISGTEQTNDSDLNKQPQIKVEPEIQLAEETKPAEVENEDRKLIAMNIYNEQFKAFPNQLAALSRGIPTDSVALAMYYYQREEYKTCLDVLTGLRIKDKNNEDYLFYSAICLMYETEFSDAISLFNTINNNKKSKYKTEISWYTALIYLRTKRITEAIEMFRILAESSNVYSARAKEVVEKLTKKNNL